jgi:pteridine reductase
MSNQSLNGRVALVTGSARRIGAAIISVLHAQGMNVVLHYWASGDEAKKRCHDFNQIRPHSAMALRSDLNDVDCIQNLVEKAHIEWNRLDVLVNNASRFYRTDMGKTTEYAWNDLMNSNLKAPFFMAQAAAPFLAKNQGCIINVTDIHTERPLKDYAVYCISKSALTMMTKVLAKELGPEVRVNGVAPGAILWPEGDNALSDEMKKKIIDRTALSRSGDPVDIANAVLYFVRDGGFVTGQILHIDGGRSLS